MVEEKEEKERRGGRGPFIFCSRIILSHFLVGTKNSSVLSHKRTRVDYFFGRFSPFWLHSIHNISCFHGSEAFSQATTQKHVCTFYFLGGFHLNGIQNIHNISFFFLVSKSFVPVIIQKSANIFLFHKVLLHHSLGRYSQFLCIFIMRRPFLSSHHTIKPRMALSWAFFILSFVLSECKASFSFHSWFERWFFLCSNQHTITKCED